MLIPLIYIRHTYIKFFYYKREKEEQFLEDLYSQYLILFSMNENYIKSNFCFSDLGNPESLACLIYIYIIQQNKLNSSQKYNRKILKKNAAKLRDLPNAFPLSK